MKFKTVKYSALKKGDEFCYRVHSWYKKIDGTTASNLEAEHQIFGFTGDQDVEIEVADCEDCCDEFEARELIPYKYEPQIKLCESCNENRMNDDE